MAKISSIRRTMSMAMGDSTIFASLCGLAACRARDVRHLEEGASGVRPAGGLDQGTRSSSGIIEILVSGIGVSLEEAGISRQMGLGVLGPSIAGIVEHGRRRVRAGEGPVVAHIGPDPAGLGLPLGQDRNCGVVAMKAAGAEHMRLDERQDGLQRDANRSHGVGQCRQGNGDPFTGNWSQRRFRG